MSSRAAPGGDPILEAADRLHSAAIHLLRLLRREDRGAGIGPARLSALSVLVFGGPRTLGELAAAEQVRPSTMSRIVAALEAEGLLRRRAVPADRRAARLVPTAAGRRLMREGRRRRVEALAGRLRGLTPAERRRLAGAAAILARLARPDASSGAAR